MGLEMRGEGWGRCGDDSLQPPQGEPAGQRDSLHTHCPFPPRARANNTVMRSGTILWPFPWCLWGETGLLLWRWCLQASPVGSGWKGTWWTCCLSPRGEQLSASDLPYSWWWAVAQEGGAIQVTIGSPGHFGSKVCGVFSSPMAERCRAVCRRLVPCLSGLRVFSSRASRCRAGSGHMRALVQPRLEGQRTVFSLLLLANPTFLKLSCIPKPALSHFG